MSEKVSGGVYLRNVRHAARMTLVEAGERAEPPISFGHLSQIEKGTVVTPNILMLPRLAQVYGVSIPEILSAYGVEVEVASGRKPVAQEIGERILLLNGPNRDSVLAQVESLLREQPTAVQDQPIATPPPAE